MLHIKLLYAMTMKRKKPEYKKRQNGWKTKEKENLSQEKAQIYHYFRHHKKL